MSKEMPKRIWAWQSMAAGGHWRDDESYAHSSQYVRADVTKAAQDELLGALKEILMWNGLKSSDGIRAIAREAIERAEGKA